MIKSEQKKNIVTTTAVFVVVILIAGGIAFRYYEVYKTNVLQGSTNIIPAPSAPLGVVGDPINKSNTQSVSNLTAATSSAAENISATQPTSSLDSIGSFNGTSLNYETSTIDGVTFNVLPVYNIGQTYTNQCNSGDCDTDYTLENWYTFGDYKLVADWPSGWVLGEVDIYKHGQQVGGVGVGGVLYGPLSVRTFSYQGRDYFILKNNSNCGTSGCNDVSILFSTANNSSTTSFELWDNGWGWDDGSTEPSAWGDENGGALNFVIAYQGNIFLFPQDGPVVEADSNGNKILIINKNGSSTIPEILQAGG